MKKTLWLRYFLNINSALQGLKGQYQTLCSQITVARGHKIEGACCILHPNGVLVARVFITFWPGGARLISFRGAISDNSPHIKHQ